MDLIVLFFPEFKKKISPPLSPTTSSSEKISCQNEAIHTFPHLLPVKKIVLKFVFLNTLWLSVSAYKAKLSVNVIK